MAQIINGTAGNDTLTGTNLGDLGNPDGVDTINGLGGNDTLSGLGENDTLNGGDGDDVLAPGFAGPFQSDSANGGDGTDTLVVSFAAAGFLLRFFGAAAGTGNVPVVPITTNVAWVNMERFDVVGTAFRDVIFGYDFDDRLSGGLSSDTVFGGSGNDRVIGGAGADTLDGGAGTYDTLSYEGSTAGGVTVTLVDGSTGSGGDAQGDSILAGFENLVGSVLNDNLTGNALDNVLVGGTGGDVMTGGLGNDSYDVDNLLDVVIEDANEGTDAIYSRINYVLAAGASIEKLVAFNGLGPTALTGNELKQSIWGNGDNNVLTGRGAGDVLVGLGGNDTFLYEAESDAATGSGEAISGFSTGDLIDLQAVFGGTLVFRGTGAYTGTPGEVRYTVANATTLVVRVNLDGDFTDEMQIVVTGVGSLAGTDFVL